MKELEGKEGEIAEKFESLLEDLIEGGEELAKVKEYYEMLY